MRNFAITATLFLFLFAYNTALADTTFSGAIVGDVVWTKANGPYLINYVSIPAGASLTIEPGTIIKVADNSYPFIVDGTLTIGSTGGEQVVITSMKDDTVGGDTNGDGGVTTPNSGDWREMTFNLGSIGNMTNTTIRYGGSSVYNSWTGGYFIFPLIDNKGGTLSLTNVTLSKSGNNGLEQFSGTTTITNSTISDLSRGVINYGGSLTIGNNTFSNLGDYGISVYTATNFTNNGGNTGGRGIYMAYSITGNQTWAKDNIPYVANSISIPNGSSLTIAPGAVVKATTDTFPFYVDGTFVVGSPTATENAMITSIKDDTVGGDTNNDGSATTPQAGDWRKITMNAGANVTVAHATIKYGGATPYNYWTGGYFTFPLIENNGGILSINNSELAQSGYYGVLQNSGTTTIVNSTLANISKFGVIASQGFLSVASTTFDTMERGVVANGGTLELGGNSFATTSSYAASIEGSSIAFNNHGGNSGSKGLFISESISGAQTLPKDGLVYIVNYLAVPAGSTLTILPGAVIKVPVNGSPFTIDGTLNIGSSTSTEETYATSINDDAVGGDTNGNGTSTIPASGEWKSITFNPGSTATIHNTTIRYGGAAPYNPWTGGPDWYPAIKNNGGTLAFDHTTLINNGKFGILQLAGTTTLAHSEISHTDAYGVQVVNGIFSIHDSSIHDNGTYGLYSSSPTISDATGNWWGAASGPTHSSNPGGTGDNVSNNVDFSGWTGSDPTVGCVINCNSNVLFLPGIMGSRLYWTDPSCVLINCENKLWVPNRNDDVEDLYMATGTSVLSNIYTKEDDILLEGGPFGADFYKVFADDMNRMVASGNIEAWKPIAYDWRYDYDHLLSGGLPLDGKIYYDVPTSFPYILEELYALASSSRTGKVTIIAHSNGGLLAKTLIQKLKDTGHADLVDNLILVASPQLGTPQAIGALLHGYDASPLKYYVGKSAQRKLAHDMPMIYNLLPSEKYLSTVSTPVIFFDEDVPAHALWGDEIGSTGEYLAYLLGTDDRPNPDYGELEDPAIANESLLTSALQWHANFDDWVAPTTTAVYQIAGWGVDTVSGIQYSNDAWLSDFSWDYEPIITDDGDGTVVTPSALGNDGQKYWVNLNKYKDDTDNTIKHGEIFEIPQLRTLIANIIRKEDITNPGEYISTSRPSAVDIEKRLRYFLHSPLTLELYDNFGRHVGVSTTTGLIEEQIPGASYNEFGEVKYISVPASASTTLIMRGEGEGRFTLNIKEVTGGIITATTTFANIPVSTSTLVTMSVPENPTLSTLPGLSIDQDGNGTIDAQVLPGTVLSPDVTPPAERITFSTSTQKLLFSGLDVSSTSIATTATSTTVTDASGNTLRTPYLSYKEKNRRVLLSFKTLVYNGSTITIATTTVRYKWKTDASGKYTMFATFIKTGSTTIEVHYRPKKNQTIIMTKPTDFDDSDADDDCDVRPIKQRLQGMVVPGIQTSNGNINVTY